MPRDRITSMDSIVCSPLCANIVVICDYYYYYYYFSLSLHSYITSCCMYCCFYCCRCDCCFRLSFVSASPDSVSTITATDESIFYSSSTKVRDCHRYRHICVDCVGFCYSMTSLYVVVATTDFSSSCCCSDSIRDTDMIY